MNKRILIVATNQTHLPESKTPTGLWLSELTHFWDILTIAGYKLDITSPNGGKIPLDPRSLSWLSMDRSTKKRFQERTFMQKLTRSIKLSQISWRKYDAVYYTGGHGAMVDFPENESIQIINRKMYENEKVVASVCHGYCAFLNSRLSSGRHLVEGKLLTGFSWMEEQLAGVSAKVPYNSQKEIKKRQAVYQKGLLPFCSHVKIDGRLITGQNPASTKETARQVLRKLEQQNENEKGKKQKRQGRRH